MLLQLHERIRAWIAQRDDHHYLGRYSITKLQHFEAYQRTASRGRVIAVILFTPIPTFLALMAMDVVPMNHPSAGPRQNAPAFIRSTISHAVMTFVTLLPLKQALSLSHRGSTSASPLESARYARPATVRTSEPHAPPPTIFIDGIAIARRHQARVLEQTLQLLFVCEVLLFAEYMEVVIPVLYAFVLGGEWLSPNASYNIVVSAMTAEQIGQQVWSSLLYALVELASLLVMYYVMHRKYGVSAFYLLAFVLEKYWMTLQGKLVGAFIVVMNAVTVQQGALGV